MINDDENICIMIGGENHLSLQVFSAGLALENALNLAIEIDQKLEEIFPYAVNKKYGYLTKGIKDVGTGLRASVMLHLPALSKTRNMQKILEAINDLGMNIKGIYGEDPKKGEDFYQISNKQTIGVTEKAIIYNLKVIVQEVMEKERQARKLLARNEIELEDIVYRSYGILKYCKKISYEEMRELLSNIKLGTDLGILQELNDLKVQKLYLYSKPANLQKYFGETFETIEAESKRAQMAKQIMGN